MVDESVHSDSELIKSIIHGDTHEFDTLVRRYGKMIFNLCYRFLNNYDDANDCAQDTFIRAFRKIKTFKSESRFSTWLSRIAINTCKNYVTSAAVKKNNYTDSIENTTSQQDSTLFHTAEQVDEAVLKKEQSKIIMDAVHSLQKDLRSIVILRDYEDKQLNEIAEILSIPVGTVKSKLSRARKTLRAELEGKL
jgi:RNA polymerase sigma-70 factor (ECF subfamily)